LRLRIKLVGLLIIPLVFFLFIFFFPVFWFLTLSLKTQLEAFTYPPLIIFKPKLINYVSLFTSAVFVRSFLNSIVVATGTVLFTLLVGTPAAFGLARAKLRFKQYILAWMLVTRMAPGMIYVIPYFVAYRELRLLDTRVGLMVIYLIFVLPLFVWMMTTFFEDIPRDLEEAAKIDGAGIFQAFTRITLPLATPGLAATAIICFIFSWNEFLFALVLTRQSARTAPIAIVNFMAYEGTEWGKVAASGIVVLLPVLIFSMIVRKYLVKGLVKGAIKE